MDRFRSSQGCRFTVPRLSPLLDYFELIHNRRHRFSVVFGAFASCDEAIDVTVVARYRRISEAKPDRTIFAA